MTDSRAPQAHIDVLIIGGGPAGLSAATELKRLGIAHVVVLDRELQAGGIPRHCGHPPFGMREFKRVFSGPQYAHKLVEAANKAGVEIRNSTTVVEIQAGGQLLLVDPKGAYTLSAKRIIYATGVRETPRSARLISGSRPLGVMNTGALQSTVYLKHQRPFKHPVIVGTELVSFSAIQTCLHAGIQPRAMIEQNKSISARQPASLYAHFKRVPLHLQTRLLRIDGRTHVEAVTVENADGEQRQIECDGVILSGRFTPDATLARSGHLDIDPHSGGPRVDQFGRCSDPVYFATGNLLRPVETAGWSWNEGRETAQRVALDINGKLPDPGTPMPLIIQSPLIQYAMPQQLNPDSGKHGMTQLQLRFTQVAKGTLQFTQDGIVLWQKKISSRPERRILIAINQILENRKSSSPIELHFKAA